MPLPASPWIVSCGGDTIKLWDLEKNFWTVGADGCHAATVSYSPKVGSAVLCARWNHTNYVVASAGEDPCIIMWTSQGQRLGSIPDGPVEKSEEKMHALCFSRRSRMMITAGSGPVIRVWDMKRRVCTQKLSGHTGTVTAVAMNAKDEQLASVSDKGTLCLHNLNSGARVAQLKDPEGQALQAVEYSPHAKHLLATAGDGGAVHLWNATSRKVERSWKRAHAAPVMGLCFSPTDPKVLVTVGLDKRLVIIDPTSSAPPFRVSAEVPLSCAHFKDDGVTVAVGTTDGRILFYDVRVRVWKTQQTLQAFKKSVQVTCVQWQSSLHADESDAEPAAPTVEVNFQPEIDLRSVPANLRGTDKVMASLGSALFSPRDKANDLHGVNGGLHTPARGGGERIPSEMDVFSPLVEVQPITPYVPKHWEGEKSAAESLRGGERDGGLNARLPGSRLSFTEVANRPVDGPTRSGESSPGARMPGKDFESRLGGLEARLGEPPSAQFSSVSDLRQEAKRKLQASISAKAGGGARPFVSAREEEPGTSAQSSAYTRRPSTGGSRSGPFDRDPQQDPLHNPPLTTRNPSFDQLMSTTGLPPRYSHLPTSLEATPADRAFGAPPKPGTFTSTMYASARLLADSRNTPPPEAPTAPPQNESLSFGSPVAPSDAHRSLPRYDVTPSMIASPAQSYDSTARPLTSSAVLSGRDTISPDWLSSRSTPDVRKAEAAAAPNAHVSMRPDAPFSAAAASAAPSVSETESSSGRQSFPQTRRPSSTDPPRASEPRGGFAHQDGFSHQRENGSPGSRRVSDGSLGADRGTGIGRKQEFGQGKDVRWHENAIVGVDADSRPPSEPQSVAPTPHAQPFSLQLVQRALEDSLAPLQRAFHQDVHNLHLELLRQFHIQQGETQALVASILERQAALEEEVKALRKENQQLKHFF